MTSHRRYRYGLLAIICMLVLWAVQPCQALVITEIMYHPVEDDGTPSGDEPVTVVDYRLNEVTLTVDMTAPGFVVLTDTYYPGWKATVDDRENVKVHCVDTTIRGVFLEEGPHTIRFYFRPASLLIGAAISGIGFLILVIVTLGYFIRRRATRPVPPSQCT